MKKVLMGAVVAANMMCASAFASDFTMGVIGGGESISFSNQVTTAHISTYGVQAQYDIGNVTTQVTYMRGQGHEIDGHTDQVDAQLSTKINVESVAISPLVDVGYVRLAFGENTANATYVMAGAKAEYSPIKNVSLYGKGAAGRNFSTMQNQTVDSTGGFAYTVGGGAQYKVSDAVSVGLEYDHTQMPFGNETSLVSNSYVAKVNYRF